MKVPLSFKEQVNKNSGALLEYLKKQYHESQHKKICSMFTVHFGVLYVVLVGKNRLPKG